MAAVGPTSSAPVLEDRHAMVDGLRLRYFEAGSGLPVLLLHGASLGSSADVFLRNVPPLAVAGLRPIAFDQPGFGLSDVPANHSTAFRRDSIPKFIRALGLTRVAVVAHSQAGAMAVELALADAGLFSHMVILSTGSLLPPPADGAATKKAAAQTPLEWQAKPADPTIEDTRKLLEQNLFHRELITDDELALRHSRSIGRNHQAFLARQVQDAAPTEKQKGKPLWQRLPDLAMPLLMIYGRQDRARAAERAELLKATYPQLDLHIVDGCKHLLPWDAADDFVRLTVPFLKRERP